MVFRGGSSGFHVQIGTFSFSVVADPGGLHACRHLPATEIPEEPWGRLHKAALIPAQEAHFPARHTIAGNRSTSHVGGGNDPIPEETAVFPGETEILN